jgi:predicted transcriptional regulator of viral defense system
MRGEMRSHQALAELAERQHGVVSFRQLRELGFSKGKIARSHGAFRLVRIHRGVYAVGQGRISDHGRCMAAVLASGHDAVLSHLSAAWLWGLHDRCPAEIEVTVTNGARRRPGIRPYRATSLDGEWGHIAEIPVTALHRTLLAVAATQPTRRLSDVIDRAVRRDLLDMDAIDRFLSRRSRSPGARQLGVAVDLYRDPVFDRARSERLFLALVKKAGLPRPAINTWVGEFEIDAYWSKERFAVEVDGWETHGTRQAFEADRVRIEDMKLAGIDAIRITARRIERQPHEVAKRLRLHLLRRRSELQR